MKHEEHYRVNSHFTDVNGILRAGGVLKYMQETAALGMAADGPSFESLLGMGYTFVLSRLTVSIYADIRAYEELEAETWACPGRGFSFERCFRLLRDGQPVAEGSSVWALFRIADRRLVRQGEISLGYVTDEPLELDVPARIRFPNETELSLVGERTVRYSDIDRNGHMNNTVYVDMFCDFIPKMAERRVVSFSIAYLNEAPLDTVLKVYREEYDGTFYLRTVLPDGKVNAEAEMILEDI